METFPKVVFVSLREPGDGEFFVCENRKMDAIEDDGPTKVATYQLVEVHTLEKSLVSKKSRNETY